MRQNGNKIWHIKYKRSLKLAAAMLAVSLAFPMAAQAKAWDFENGSYVRCFRHSQLKGSGKR